MVNEEEWHLTAEKFQSVLEPTAQDYKAKTVISPLLEEVILHFRHGIPPFLSRKASQRGHRKDSVLIKTVRLAENDDLDHNEPREGTIIYRRWNDEYGFWTLDLHGERLILKPMRGGLFGGYYLPWLNCMCGFGSDPIAYIGRQRSQAYARRSVKKNKLVRDNAFRKIPPIPQKKSEAHGHLDGVPRAKRSAKAEAQVKIKDALDSLLSPVIEPTYPSKNADDGRSIKLKLRCSKLEGPAIESPQHNFKRESVQTPANSINSGPQASMNGEYTDRKSPDPASADRRRQFFSTPESTKVASGLKRTHDAFSAPDPKDVASASKRRREALLLKLFPSSERLGRIAMAPEPTHANTTLSRGNSAVLKGTSGKATDSESDVGENPQGIAYPTSVDRDDSAEELAQVGASSETLIQPTTAEEPNPLDLLGPQKLSNTFLLVTVPPSLDFKIAKLSSCVTVSDVTTTILQQFKMGNKVDQIDAFRFKFEWLPANANYRKLLIEPDQMSSSFDYVLKRIDKADLWATEGECYLGVDILLKKSAK